MHLPVLKVSFSVRVWTASQLRGSSGIHHLVVWDGDRLLTARCDLRSSREVTEELSFMLGVGRKDLI